MKRDKVNLDIFLRQGIIQEVSSKGKSRFYCLGKQPHVVTLDEIFAKILEEENLTINQIYS